MLDNDSYIIMMRSAFFEAERDGAALRHPFLLKFEIF